MIVALGTDIVDVSRFAAMMSRTPGVAERLFTDAERASLGDSPGVHRFAARFAAKEAVVKALGGAHGLSWHHCEVLTAPNGQPSLRLTASVEAAALKQGLQTWRVSLSHDGGFAMATVIAIGADAPEHLPDAITSSDQH